MKKFTRFKAYGDDLVILLKNERVKGEGNRRVVVIH